MNADKICQLVDAGSWDQLIPNYNTLSKTKRKLARMQYHVNRYSSECTETFDIPTPGAIYPTKEDNMNSYNNVNVEAPRNENDAKRAYLNERKYTISFTKELDLRKAFHLDPDDDPVDGKAMVDRILAGKYTLKARNDRWSNKEYQDIIWRDPATPPDEDGYSKAMDALNTRSVAVGDDIHVKDPVDALASLQAFEKETFH